MSTNFGQFNPSTPVGTDYLVGYRPGSPSVEKRFLVSDIPIPPRVPPIIFTFDGGGSVLTPGASFRAFVLNDCTLTAWELQAWPTGSMQLYVKVATPVGGVVTPHLVSITGGSDPSINSPLEVEGQFPLSGWTTTLHADDVIEVGIVSVTAATKAILILTTI